MLLVKDIVPVDHLTDLFSYQVMEKVSQQIQLRRLYLYDHHELKSGA